MNLTLESRIQRLNEMMNDGRIIRHGWVSADEQGRETACLLAALSPEVAKAETASACPAAVMPPWMAYFTPWMDDNCSNTEWPRVIRRYAACANLWSTLDEAAWRRVEIAARRAAVEEAMRHTSDDQALAACRGALVWLDAGMPESSRVDVGAARSAEAAAGLAAWSAEAAAGSAAWSAEAAAGSAAWSAEAAAASAAAGYGAADRIIDAVLSSLERECQA